MAKFGARGIFQTTCKNLDMRSRIVSEGTYSLRHTPISPDSFSSREPLISTVIEKMLVPEDPSFSILHPCLLPYRTPNYARPLVPRLHIKETQWSKFHF